MRRNLILGALGLLAGAAALAAPAMQKSPGYDDTPLLPDGKWRVHDSKRPHPKVIVPGTFSTQEQPGKPPSDAVVLFDGTDLSKWSDGKGNPPSWKVENGYMEVAGKGGSLFSREEFGDCQLHVEWCAPVPPKGDSQGRGNSGVIIMNQFEIQVLDSYENVTYADGQAAAIYGQYPPLVNACRPPGQWQTYDIAFTAPRWKDGKLEAPAYVTVFHNGVLVHHHTAILGPVQHRNVAKYGSSGPSKGPLQLQDHGNPVRYRNIWYRPLKGYDEP